MKITPEAAEDVRQLMAENSLDGIRVEIQETCCGSSPVVGLDIFEEEEKPEEISGIPTVISPEARDKIEDLVLDKIDGNLVILNADVSCGCGAGCSGCSSH